MFAVIAPALMTGAFADRVNFGPYMVFIASGHTWYISRSAVVGAVAGWPNKAFGILPVGSSFT